MNYPLCGHTKAHKQGKRLLDCHQFCQVKLTPTGEMTMIATADI
jgi:hypothetical protein